MLDDIFFAAEIDTHIATVDLHEFCTVPEALEQLEKKLFLLFNSGTQYARVIHGIGSGRLAEAVHAALSKNPMIQKWKESEPGGSCIILF